MVPCIQNSPCSSQSTSCDLPQEKLGVTLEKEDEMECLVAGCNFLFKAIYHEAFMFEHGKTSFVTGTGTVSGKLSSADAAGVISAGAICWLGHGSTIRFLIFV